MFAALPGFLYSSCGLGVKYSGFNLRILSSTVCPSGLSLRSVSPVFSCHLVQPPSSLSHSSPTPIPSSSAHLAIYPHSPSHSTKSFTRSPPLTPSPHHLPSRVSSSWLLVNSLSMIHRHRCSTLRSSSCCRLIMDLTTCK